MSVRLMVDQCVIEHESFKGRPAAGRCLRGKAGMTEGDKGGREGGMEGGVTSRAAALLGMN